MSAKDKEGNGFLKGFEPFSSNTNAPGLELRLLQRMTHRFPRMRGFGHLADLVSRFYNRKPRVPVLSSYRGLRFLLEPAECVDSKVLFYPHLYDANEIEYLSEVLEPGDVFVDVGSNIGFYSLLAAKMVGPHGRVVAIEADLYNHGKLENNIRLNSIENIITVNCGVSDRAEKLELGINKEGNRGGNSFLLTSDCTISVQCRPLLDVLRSVGAGRVKAMKLDIEGFEYRVMKRFFLDASYDLYPPHILFEAWDDRAGISDLLETRGYMIRHVKDVNFVAILER